MVGTYIGDEILPLGANPFVQELIPESEEEPESPATAVEEVPVYWYDFILNIPT